MRAEDRFGRRIGSEDRSRRRPVVILLQTGEAGKPLAVRAVFGDVALRLPAPNVWLQNCVP